MPDGRLVGTAAVQDEAEVFGCRTGVAVHAIDV
jgi:hypothetical protein